MYYGPRNQISVMDSSAVGIEWPASIAATLLSHVFVYCFFFFCVCVDEEIGIAYFIVQKTLTPCFSIAAIHVIVVK